MELDPSSVVRSLARRAGTAVVVAALAAAPVLAQEAAAAKVDTTPRKLFRSQEVVTMTITVDLKKLVRMRERQSAPLPATLIYDAGAQGKDTMLISVGTRGNFRLQGRNCAFPPIRLFFSKAEIKGSIFEHQKDLKLVTRCQHEEEYEQYILQEEPIYRIYNMLTPVSMRTRLVRVTYADSLKKEKPVVTYAFLVEDADDVARRIGGKPFSAKRAVWDDVDGRLMKVIGVMEFMIANTDWSLGALHNMKLVRAADNFSVLPMAYDFDWSGVINPALCDARSVPADPQRAPAPLPGPLHQGRERDGRDREGVHVAEGRHLCPLRQAARVEPQGHQGDQGVFRRVLRHPREPAQGERRDDEQLPGAGELTSATVATIDQRAGHEVARPFHVPPSRPRRVRAPVRSAAAPAGGCSSGTT